MAKVKGGFDSPEIESLILSLVYGEIRVTIIPGIKELISKGISPVEGYGRFKEYSESYKTRIKNKKTGYNSKRERPVNLYLSGKMLNSDKVRKTSKGFIIEFTDKKFKKHNFGIGGMPQRKMTPTGKEQLSRTILSKFGKKLHKNINIVL